MVTHAARHRVYSALVGKVKFQPQKNTALKQKQIMCGRRTKRLKIGKNKVFSNLSTGRTRGPKLMCIFRRMLIQFDQCCTSTTAIPPGWWNPGACGYTLPTPYPQLLIISQSSWDQLPGLLKWSCPQACRASKSTWRHCIWWKRQLSVPNR